MAAEFDTQPDYMSDEDPSPQHAPEEPRSRRNARGWLALLALAAIILFLLIMLNIARVPNVVGLSRSAAEAKLERAGFSVGDLSEVPADSGKSGDVTGQAPRAGATVRKGTSVDLMLAIGAQLGTVPDVCDHDAASASVDIQQAGFEIASAEEYSDTTPIGIAVSQEPLGGSQAVLGSVVTVSYSLGPHSAAQVAVLRSDTDDGLTDADRGTTGSGTEPLIMSCTRAYPSASAWSSGGDIYVRLTAGGAARRVTSTGDWDTAPVISPSHKYLVFLRASGSGKAATGVGAVCFTTFGTHMLSLPDVGFVGVGAETYGRPIFAPSADSTHANTDWIVFPQYWSEQYWGDTRRSARLIISNVPMSSSWVSWNQQFRPAQTLSLGRSSKPGCVSVTQKSGARTVYSRHFNATTGLYLR